MVAFDAGNVEVGGLNSVRRVVLQMLSSCLIQSAADGSLIRLMGF